MAHSLPAEYLFPFLAIMLAVLTCLRLAGIEHILKTAFVPVVFAVSAGLSFLRLGSLSLSEYLLSLSPSFSAGLIAFTMIVLYEQIRKKKILSNRDLLIFSGWNVVISVALFLSSFGFIDTDLYYQGYGFSVWFVIPALLAIILALKGSPVAGIFVAYLAAYDIGMLKTGNIWDYMTDGVLFLVSLGILSLYAVKLVFLRRTIYDR